MLEKLNYGFKLVMRTETSSFFLSPNKRSKPNKPAKTHTYMHWRWQGIC